MRIGNGRVPVLLAAVALVVNVGAAAVPAPGPTVEQSGDLAQYVPDVAPSSTLEGPALVTGAVEGAPAGVPVIATAWPDQDTLGALRPGDIVNLVPIAASLTDADGSFTLVADPGAVRDLLGEDEQIVNFDLYVPTGDGEPARFAASAELSAEIVEDGSEDEVLAKVEASIEAAEPLTVDEVVNRDGDTVTYNESCGAIFKTPLDARPMTVGSSYSTNPKVTADFTYAKGATTEAGVGFSVSGKVGSFEASGTTSVTSAATTAYDPVKGVHAKYYKKTQDYGKFTHLCTAGASSYTYVDVRPVGNPYGGYVANVSTPTANHCASYGATLTLDEEKAMTWAGGVALDSLIGINLSAQTGWSSKTSLTFTRPTGVTYKVCGTKGKPEQPNAGQMVAK
ncbi:hypothetical protein [Cellulomonas sp.]|uniref:hypothetical protein n=1 Tax=Cellulomonas sp. TaxID=40001 RepID=UPI002585C410|nr:hypothetical protein [Cellulomonas sp.]MCR6688843.1 hypothetical protein [Cellulomonas sp.]